MKSTVKVITATVSAVLLAVCMIVPSFAARVETQSEYSPENVVLTAASWVQFAKNPVGKTISYRIDAIKAELEEKKDDAIESVQTGLAIYNGVLDAANGTIELKNNVKDDLNVVGKAADVAQTGLDLGNSAFDLKNNIADTVSITAKAQEALDLANSAFDLYNNIKDVKDSDGGAVEVKIVDAPKVEPPVVNCTAPAAVVETPAAVEANFVAATDGID